MIKNKHNNKTLNDRMKEYESNAKIKLIKKMPVIIRVDGRAFHTFTKGFVKPFDTLFLEAMRKTALDLFKSVPNCRFAYTESDEITLILDDSNTILDTAFYDNDLEKLVSVTASMTTMFFNNNFASVIERGEKSAIDTTIYKKKLYKATFDSRAFNVPYHEVDNVILDRQLDSKRNSLNAYAQSLYPQKVLNGKKHDDLIDLLHAKGMKYHDIDVSLRHGVAVYKDETDKVVVDYDVPSLLIDKTFVSRRVFDIDYDVVERADV